MSNPNDDPVTDGSDHDAGKMPILGDEGSGDRGDAGGDLGVSDTSGLAEGGAAGIDYKTATAEPEPVTDPAER